MENIARSNKEKGVSIKSSNENGKHQILAEQHSIRVGPIPSPEEFAKYKEVMPDLPERIIHQFEQDSESIRALQKNAQAADIRFDKRSQWMAFIVLLMGIGATCLLAYLDKDVASAATGIATAMLVFKGTFNKK